MLANVQMTLQKFIDNLFASVTTVDSSLPPAVKYLFDFYDSAAERHGLDANVVHVWKTNRYSLQPQTRVGSIYRKLRGISVLLPVLLDILILCNICNF